jgi:AcrR family transcriptional regulator
LLLEKDFEDITINELCDLAEVRRATFYKHFDDKRDFLRYYVYRKRLIFDIRAKISNMPKSTPEYYLEYPKGIIKFLCENERLTRRALESSAASTIIDVVKEQNYIDTRDRLRESEKGGMPLPVSCESLATMLTGAITDMIVKWFKDGRPISEKELISEMSKIIRAMLNA